MILFLLGVLCGIVFLVCFGTCEDLYSNSHRYKYL